MVDKPAHVLNAGRLDLERQIETQADDDEAEAERLAAKPGGLGRAIADAPAVDDADRRAKLELIADCAASPEIVESAVRSLLDGGDRQTTAA